MANKDFTRKELSEFDRITLDMSSPNQLNRIAGRLAIRTFIDRHGKAKCDVMWEAIKRKEGQDGQ
jgi:hypothetical protein